MVAVAYKRWSFSRVSVYKALPEKILVVWIHGRLEEDMSFKIEMVAIGLSTLMFVVSRRVIRK